MSIRFGSFFCSLFAVTIAALPFWACSTATLPVVNDDDIAEEQGYSSGKGDSQVDVVPSSSSSSTKVSSSSMKASSSSTKISSSSEKTSSSSEKTSSSSEAVSSSSENAPVSYAVPTEKETENAQHVTGDDRVEKMDKVDEALADTLNKELAEGLLDSVPPMIYEGDMDFENNDYYCFTADGTWYKVKNDWKSWWLKAWNKIYEVFTGKRYYDFREACDGGLYVKRH